MAVFHPARLSTRTADAPLCQASHGLKARPHQADAEEQDGHIKFRRPEIFTAATTPLIEGVTPTDAVSTKTSRHLRQYGQVVVITDKIEDLHEDPVLNDASMQAGENIGRTIEALNYGVIRAGTQVYYANGTQRTDVNTPITLSKQRAVLRSLKALKAQKITRSLSPSSDYGTRAVEAAYVAVAHTDVESDLRNMPGFKTVAEYGTRSPVSEYEIGSVEDVRHPVAGPQSVPRRWWRQGRHGVDIRYQRRRLPDRLFRAGRMGHGRPARSRCGFYHHHPVGRRPRTILGQRGYVG